MRKEYDFSKGTRGKFYGKVDTKNPIIEEDETLPKIFDEELSFLESNLERIKKLQTRFPELAEAEKQKISKRITKVSESFEEIALAK
jgi:uncharacterized protein YicC (UPF0701 family)